MLDDSKPQSFAEIFMADKRQLGMILVGLIEDKDLESRVEKTDIGWNLADLDAFIANEAGPEKKAFAAFIRFIRERQIGGSKATKLQTFWIEQGGEEYEESLEQDKPEDDAPAAAPVPPEATAQAGMPADTPNPPYTEDEEERGDAGMDDDAPDVFGDGDSDDGSAGDDKPAGSSSDLLQDTDDVLGDDSPGSLGQEDDDLMGEGTGSPAPTPPEAPTAPTPAELGRNIRAAMKKAGKKLLATLKAAGVDVDQMFMSEFEKGHRSLSEDEFARIADLCEVDVAQLQTGNGLERFFPKSGKSKNALVPVKQTIELPPVSPEQMAEHFMSRVVSNNVKPASGIEAGQLMTPIGAAFRGEEVDWVHAWTTLTADGQRFQNDIDEMARMLAAKGPILQTVFLQRLAATLFPPEDPS